VKSDEESKAIKNEGVDTILKTVGLRGEHGQQVKVRSAEIQFTHSAFESKKIIPSISTVLLESASPT
jgi:hypothetical protein